MIRRGLADHFQVAVHVSELVHLLRHRGFKGKPETCNSKYKIPVNSSKKINKSIKKKINRPHRTGSIKSIFPLDLLYRNNTHRRYKFQILPKKKGKYYSNKKEDTRSNRCRVRRTRKQLGSRGIILEQSRTLSKGFSRTRKFT